MTFAGCAVVVSALVLLLKQHMPEMGLMITVGAGVVLLGAVLTQLVPVFNELYGIIGGTQAADYFPVVLKALGICVVTRLAADICRDAGQQTTAAGVEMAGRLAMVVTALPLLSSVLETASQLIIG